MNRLTVSAFFLLTTLNCFSQDFTTSKADTTSKFVFRPASEYNLKWQRLLLQLSATYFTVVKESLVDLDSSLLYTSKSLGLSRLPLIAEGINNPELINQSQWIDNKKPKTGVHLLSQATGKRRLELLVLLGAYYSFQPDSYHHYRDSVEYFLSKAILESKSVPKTTLGRQALCLLGKMYVQGADLKRGDSVFNKVILECKQTGDKETEARAFSYRGLYTFYSRTTTEDRIMYLQKARDIYHALEDTENEINTLTNTGYLLVASYRLPDAYNSFITALRLEESIAYPYIHYNTDAIAMVSGFQGKFGEPFKYALESIEASKNCRDSIGWAYFYSRLGVYYFTEGEKTDEALIWMKKALDRFLLGNGDAGLYINLYNITSALHSQGNAKSALSLLLSTAKKIPPLQTRDIIFYKLALSYCYIDIDQNAVAESLVKDADQLQRKTETLRGPFARSMIATSYGYVYFADRQFAKSKQYFEQYLSDPGNQWATLKTTIGVYKYLVDIDSILHDPVSGVNHHRKYAQLLQSNFRTSKLKQAEELQVTYQTEEKEIQINLLNQRAKLEQAKLEQANLVRNVTIAGIILVFIISLLLFRQNKLKQKNNQIIRQKNGLLESLLIEKEWLLKEIHHRVKNNFQTVMGLLGTQSVYLKNEVAIKAIKDSQHRIHAMSLIHQKLYQTDNLSAINMPDYIKELVAYLRDSFAITGRIQFKLDIEHIELDLAHCIPLGLILNEAITNSFKYAFPEGKEGIISISFGETTSHHFTLSIKDNGVGSMISTSGKHSDSMGMNLMRGLSEEISADFSIDGRDGTLVVVHFVYHHHAVNEITLMNMPLAPAL